MATRKFIRYPEREIEWILAMILTGFGLALFHPDLTFIEQDYIVIPSTLLVREGTLASIFVLLGIVRLYALFRNGSWSYSIRVRHITAGLSMGVYSMLGLLFSKAFFSEATANTAAITYLLCAIWDFRNTKRIGREIGEFNNRIS